MGTLGLIIAASSLAAHKNYDPELAFNFSLMKATIRSRRGGLLKENRSGGTAGKKMEEGKFIPELAKVNQVIIHSSNMQSLTEGGHSEPAFNK